MVVDVPRSDFSGMVGVTPQYLEGLSKNIRLLQLNNLASRFYRKDAFHPQLIVISSDEGYRTAELIHLLAFDEMSQGARCAYFRYGSYYNQDVAATLRHNVRQLKRKGIKSRRTFVTFDEICTTDMGSYETLCEMVLELLSLNAFVVVHVYPEYKDTLSSLIPSATVINQNELMSGECLVAPDSTRDSDVALWQLTHGIPCLLQALAQDERAKYYPYDSRSQYARATADLISSNFARPYVFSHINTYIAAVLIGSGQIETLQAIHNTDTECFFMYESDFLPAFYIDRELDTFEVAGICDDLIFATIHTGFDEMFAGYHELIWECACVLAEQGRYVRAAEVMNICLQERKPKCILPSGQYIQRLLPHACGFVSAGRLDVAEFLASYLKSHTHLEKPDWQQQACQTAYRVLVGPYSKKAFSKTREDMRELGRDTMQAQSSLESLICCREALVHRIKPQKLVVFRRFAPGHLREAHIFTHALNMLLEGRMYETHMFLERSIRSLVPRNLFQCLILDFYAITSKLCAREPRKLDASIYYRHALLKWLKNNPPVAYINYASALVDLLMGKTTRFFDAQEACDLAKEQKDKLLEVIFRFGYLIDLVYQGFFEQAYEYAQELVASARQIHLDYVAEASILVKFLCEIELTSDISKKRSPLSSSLEIYMELVGMWGSPQLSYQTQQAHSECRDFLGKDALTAVKNSLWALILIIKAFPNVSKHVMRHIPLEWLSLMPCSDVLSSSSVNGKRQDQTSGYSADALDTRATTGHYLITSEENLFKKFCMQTADEKIQNKLTAGDKKKGQIRIRPVSAPEIYEKSESCVLIDDIERHSYIPEQSLARINESYRRATRPIHISVFNHMEITIHGEPELTSKLHVRHGTGVLALLALSQEHRATRYHIISSIWGDCDFEYGMKRLYESVAHIRRCFLQNGMKHVILVNKGNGTIRLNTDLVSCDIDEFEHLAQSTIYFEASDGQILKKGCQALDIYGTGIDLDIGEVSGYFLGRNDEIRKLAIHTSILVSSAALRHRRQHLAVLVVQQAFLMAPYRDDIFLQLVKVFVACGRMSEIPNYFKIYQENLKLLGVSSVPLEVIRDMEHSMQRSLPEAGYPQFKNSSIQRALNGSKNTHKTQHKGDDTASSEVII